MKYITIAIIILAFLTSCSEDIVEIDYKIRTVDIEINNFKVNVASEGTKKIDIDGDNTDDFGLGISYIRIDTMLQSYYFGIEPLRAEIFIATDEFIDTLYECKPTQGSGSSETTIFNSLSPFICDESMFLTEKEIKSEFYPTINNTKEIDFSSIYWSNQNLIMSQCIKRSIFTGTFSIVHDFWVNQKEKYIFFELREKTPQKGYLKLDSDGSGSYHIYEIGLEDI